MTLLILGLALWWAAHLLKRLAPRWRAALPKGGPDRGIMSVVILLSVVLMVLGYRGAEITPLFELPTGARPINYLMMFGAVLLFGMAGSKGRLGTHLRHPMLLGMITWAISHLLVNGDLASLVLFGGLGVWAVTTIFVINAKAGPWTRPAPGPASGDIKLLIISIVAYLAITTIHHFIGPSPFGM